MKDFSIDTLKKGYTFNERDNTYTCIECGDVFEEGEIYPLGDRFYTAKRCIKNHVERVHGDRLVSLLELDKKRTTLTDNQKDVLKLMAKGVSDKEIATLLNLSASTVRHIRFTMKEKMKQARMFLAISELVFENQDIDASIVPVHAHAKMVDDRYNITKDEEEDIIDKMFTSLMPLKLKTFSTKEKKKLVILRRIVLELDKEKRYTEKELNAVLKDIYDDFVTLRRYLIEYGFMSRSRDGSSYWLNGGK